MFIIVVNSFRIGEKEEDGRVLAGGRWGELDKIMLGVQWVYEAIVVIGQGEVLFEVYSLMGSNFKVIYNFHIFYQACRNITIYM